MTNQSTKKEWREYFDNYFVDWNSPRYFTQGTSTDAIKNFIQQTIDKEVTIAMEEFAKKVEEEVNLAPMIEGFYCERCNTVFPKGVGKLCGCPNCVNELDGNHNLTMMPPMIYLKYRLSQSLKLLVKQSK